MPLGNLKVDTIVGDKTIDGDTWNQEYYQRNNQKPEVKTGGIQPPTNTKTPVKTKRQAKPTDDAALIKANKKDLNNKNLNN